MKTKTGFPQINYAGEEGGGGGAAGAIAGGTATFAWPADLDAPVVDLLKSKGMYDDPVKGAIGVAKSYFELNKAHSAGNLIALPGADAKPEAWDQVYTKLGRPEAPDKYEARPVQGGFELQPPLVDFAKKLAHKWGVPAGKFNEGVAMVQEYLANENATFITKSKKASDAAVAKIRTDMGEEKYNASVGNAQKAFKAMAAQGLISQATLTALEQTIGALPVVELMAAIGQRMGGEGANLFSGAAPATGDPTQMTPEQAKAAIDKLNTDPEFQKSYWDQRHPEHKTSVARMVALMEAQHRKAA